MNRTIGSTAVLAVLVSAPLWAHHSAAAEYDAARLLTLTGTVSKVEWTNPHVFLHLAVKNRDGSVTEWTFEMASPNGMIRQGWWPTTMKIGETLTVEAFAAKDYEALAKTHRVKVPDGRWLFADSGGPRGSPK